MSLDALKKDFTPSSNRFRHAVRAAFAIALAVAAARILKLENGIWLPISVLVIMRPSLGGTLRMGWQRVLGTAIGATIGVLILLLGGDSPALLVPGILLSVFFALFLHVYTYSGFSAAITVGIVLTLGLIMPEGWKMGMVRILDTLLGVGIGVAASFMVWPNRARKSLRESMKNIIHAQSGLFSMLGESYLQGHFNEKEILAERIKVLGTLEATAVSFKEAAAEPGMSNRQRQELTRLHNTFARTQSLLTGLSTVLRRAEEGPLPQLEEGIRAYLDATSQHFAWLESYAAAPENCEECPMFNAATEEFLQLAAKQRASGAMDGVSIMRRNNISAFVWHIQALSREIHHATERISALREG